MDDDDHLEEHALISPRPDDFLLEAAVCLVDTSRVEENLAK
jgi:hypothetical protein